MNFVWTVIGKVGGIFADAIASRVEARLDKYFEAKSQIRKISGEASELKEELKGATTDAERIQILRKIAGFQDRIGS